MKTKALSPKSVIKVFQVNTRNHTVGHNAVSTNEGVSIASIAILDVVPKYFSNVFFYLSRLMLTYAYT